MQALRLFIARVEKLLSIVLVAPALRRSGVTVGRRVVFFGLPIVERAPRSSISISDRASLTSRSGMTPLGVGHRVVLRTMAAGASIDVGPDVGLSGTTVCAATSVTIGEGTLVGADCRIVDTDFHPLGARDRRYRDLPPSRPQDAVVIGRNVFLGMSVQVLKGVTIGDNSVVAAGSVVVHDLPGDSVCAGNPARPVRALEIDPA